MTFLSLAVYTWGAHQVGRHISILFDSTLEDPSLLTIPQHLLANEAASCTFADVLLSFLVHQMDDLAGYEERYAAVCP